MSNPLATATDPNSNSSRHHYCTCEMADNSDTESDSQSSVLNAEDILSRLSPAFNPTPDLPEPGTISQVIQTLLHQPLTTFRHEEIEAASSTLIRFIDDISSRLKDDADVLEVLTSFSLLVKPAFLNRLFEYRLFYENAASQTNAMSLHSTLVTWVDVLLASLSFATIAVAAATSEVQLDQGVSETIGLQKRHDSIRAATQLPDKWHKLALVVGSSNSSPAAKRIALCLLFAVYVIGPQLEATKSDPWAHDSPLPNDILINIYVGARHLSAQKPLLSGFPSTIQERTNAALIISLFAMADNEVKSRNLAVIGSSSLRPDSYGYLLKLIKSIVNEDVATRTDMPLEKLDVPQAILLRWGSAVPWSWSIWDDLRVANTEYLRVVTMTWLYHLNSPFFARLDYTMHRRIFWIDFRAILFQDCEASTGMVSNLLQHDLRSANISLESGKQISLTRRVLVKSCWAVVQYLEANSICPDPVIGRRIPEYSRCILSLFLFLDTSEEDNFVKSLLVEALTLVNPSSLGTELQMILREDLGQFLPRLDEVTRQALSHISDSRVEGVEYDHALQAAKHLLGFLTLLLHTETKNGALLGIVSSYLSALVRLLKLEGPGSLQIQVLQDSLLVALSVFMASVSTKPLSENHYDTIWNLASFSKKRNMIASSTFAQYLLASDQLCDPLICHESWDVFRDVLTAVIYHDLKEEEEQLALLISPILCRALKKLIAASQISTRQRLIWSPWTTNLRLALRKLLDSSTRISMLPYLKTLQSRLEYVGKLLLNEISDGLSEMRLSSTDSVITENLNSRLTYYRNGSASGLLLV